MGRTGGVDPMAVATRTDGLRVTDRVDEAAWRSFVAAEPCANIFHTVEMAEVFARAGGHRVVPWAACDGSGTVQALLPAVEVTLVGGPLRGWTSRAVAYGGPAWATGDDNDNDGDGDGTGVRALAALLRAYRHDGGGRALFTELRHLSDPAGGRAALRSAGFVHEGHLNYLIRLDRPEADLWRSLSRSARQRIRSAERKAVVVEEAEGPAGDEAYALLELVYGLARVPLASPSLFREARAVLGPQGMFRIVTAKLGDRVIGARFLLLHRGRIIDWYAGSDREMRSFSPNELLVWHVLRWGREQGFEVFDFGGAGRPDRPYGPREFKAKFGGDLVDFGRDVLVHAPLRLRLSRAGFGVSRRLPRGRAGPRPREVASGTQEAPA
jgi:serine/alanine adding enzyme